MPKGKRFAAFGFLLLGLGLCGGCSHFRVFSPENIPPPKDPSLPQACVWLPLSFVWSCLDWKQSEALLEQEKQDGMVPAFRLVTP